MDDFLVNNAVYWCSRCGHILGGGEDKCPNCECEFTHVAPGSEEDFARAQDTSRQQVERVEQEASPIRFMFWVAAVFIFLLVICVLLRT